MSFDSDLQRPASEARVDGHQFEGGFASHRDQFIGNSFKGDIHFHNSDDQVDLSRHEILSALAFDAMNARRIQIDQNTGEHLGWIWEPSNQAGRGFVKWLVSDEPTFWISGKPGSGKSTLMNYIAGHRECSKILNNAGERKWLVVQFYFDFRVKENTGIANSITGMLRTILFQIVQNNSVAKNALEQHRLGRDLKVQNFSLSETELCELLKHVTNEVTKTRNIIAFIDGLDEYSGSYVNLVRTMDHLLQNGIQKLCLASRPEPMLYQSFGTRPHFKMQDHNKETIHELATHTLHSACIAANRNVDTKALVEKIVRHAEGVILWARLTIDSLVIGLTEGDTEDELIQKLQQLPVQVEEMYEKLLSRIDSTKQLEIAILLQLIRTSSPVQTTLRDIHAAMVFMKEKGILTTWPKQVLTDEVFLMRFRARVGLMVDIYPLDCRIYGKHSQYCTLQARLFHKTLDDYLTDTGWIDAILTHALPHVNSRRLWLHLCSQCLLEYEVSAQDWRDFVYYNTFILTHSIPQSFAPKPYTRMAFQFAGAMSRDCMVDSAVSFLAYSICGFPLHLKSVRIEESQLVDIYKEVLGTRIMMLQCTLECRKKPYPGRRKCDSPRYCIKDGYSNVELALERLLKFSATQRAMIFAVSRGWIREAFSWRSPDNENLTIEFACEMIELIGPKKNRPLQLSHTFKSKDQICATVDLVKMFVSDDAFPELMFDSDPGYVLEILGKCAPYLAKNSGDRILRKSFSSKEHISEITANGYNLFLPLIASCLTIAEYAATAFNWVEIVQVLIDSGLNINEPCCSYGPPLHTFVWIWASELLDPQGNIRFVPLYEPYRPIDSKWFVETLISFGADVDLAFNGSTALELARTVNTKLLPHLNRRGVPNQMTPGLNGVVAELEDQKQNWSVGQDWFVVDLPRTNPEGVFFRRS